MITKASEIQKEVLVRGARSTSDTDITDAILTGWYSQAIGWATAYKKWPFTEGRIQTTYATGSGSGSDEFFFEGYKADSFRIVQVGGKRLTKLNFEDYQIMREESPEDDDRVFSDFGRTVFINPRADVSGTLVAYGQYQPAIDITDENGTTVFSSYDEEGNEAIVEKMLSYMKKRDKLMEESQMHEQQANIILDNIWKRVGDESYAYQTHPDREGMFKYFPVVDETGVQPGRNFNSDQF